MRKIICSLMATALAVAATPASAAWNEAISKHFHVYADESPQDIRAFATKLERFDAAVREARGKPDVNAGASTQVSVYVLPDVRAIQDLYGNGGAGVAGFYIPRSTGSVAFVPQRGFKGSFDLSGDSIFFHEYTHHLMLQDMDRPLPTWLTEGFAEFFASPIFNPDGSVTIGAPPKYRAEALYDQAMGGLPLNKMLTGDYLYLTALEFESLYGRGWLLTHLLSFDQRRRGQLTTYLNEIARGTPPLKAAQTAFGDLKVLDKELYDYFKGDKFTVATIPVDKLHIPPIEVRPLSPAMAAMMDSHIRFARAGDRMPAASIASRANASVQRNPGDPRATALLAKMEVAAKNYSAAIAAADAALKLDPSSESALIAKGSALMEMGKANPATADWATIRSYFSRANRIDTEDAEPLILFYRTYAAQGARPTANALDGLRYALDLAPQDAKLRIEVVGDLLKENHVDEARDTLTSLAYSPHAGKAHETVRRLYDALAAKNTALATTTLEEAKKFYDKD
jgi:tetratricopeptide (TPR) repeat protein